MANRGYKLQEFVAHSANVNCMSIGKKECRRLITGGDDHKINLWSIGKPDCLMSLCGHESPVESLAFNSEEVLVVAGASTGMIKLWDLEEAKTVHSLTGHRSYCTAVEFHPFGELFASGSMDTNLKIWDIRKKGCIHTYKGHTRGISNIRFTPDGRWVVTGGLDNVVKMWDLTAGKLLHDFKFHEGHIRTLAFHPSEFLLATGSADRTVKFWDLETFEMIGSARPEATGVRTITFHPDGKTLFCGLDDSFKVYSWEPVICHDAVDMGWSTLGDLCIQDGKLLGCSYYQNCIGIWAADISCIEPYGAGSVPEQNGRSNLDIELQESHLSEKVGGILSSVLGLRNMSPDYETKEIKNIYVDTAGENPIFTEKTKSVNSPAVILPLDSKGIIEVPTQKRSSAAAMLAKANGQALSKSFCVPYVVPRETPDRKDSANSRREYVSNARTNLVPSGVSQVSPNRKDSANFRREPVSIARTNSLPRVVPRDSPDRKYSANFRRESVSFARTNSLPRAVLRDSPDGKYSANSRRESVSNARTNSGTVIKPAHTRRPSNNKNDVERLSMASRSFTHMVAGIEGAENPTFCTGHEVKNESRESSENKHSHLKSIAEIDIVLSSQTASDQDKSKELLSSSKERSSVKFVNGVAVVSGRTRSLVERFEKKERVSGNEDRTPNMSFNVIPETDITPSPLREEPQVSATESTSGNYQNITEDLLETHDAFLSMLRSRLTKIQVVLHFWQRNDFNSAINALKKLPDHSVQADVISVLMDKMEIMTLDLFSSLLPMLVGLLDSKIERHANISMEMLLKLVAVFGPVIQSIISAPPSVGVDLHAEQRLNCCNQCHIQLQKIQEILPAFIRRGGLLAKCAQELNLVIQAS